MNLHYSQTASDFCPEHGGFTTLWIYTILKLVHGLSRPWLSFHYLMNLHYSQTVRPLPQQALSFTTLWIYTILKPIVRITVSFESFTTLWIYTILKPHSNTVAAIFVSLPYEFTLFSNINRLASFRLPVSLPYEFTLFSNQTTTSALSCCVSLPYEFTLFSNCNGL